MDQARQVMEMCGTAGRHLSGQQYYKALRVLERMEARLHQPLPSAAASYVMLPLLPRCGSSPDITPQNVAGLIVLFARERGGEREGGRGGEMGGGEDIGAVLSRLCLFHHFCACACAPLLLSLCLSLLYLCLCLPFCSSYACFSCGCACRSPPSPASVRPNVGNLYGRCAWHVLKGHVPVA